ncbi:MAG: GNAT family N-acetyltransferase [Pseudonocardia sp.]|nr:GNAT family N-acetyltransferase [Pseudonocardia sp.]
MSETDRVPTPTLPESLADPLSDVVRAALAGPQQRFGAVRGRAALYHPDVTPFGSLPPEPDEGDWQDLAELLGPGGVAIVVGLPQRAAPAGWEPMMALDGVQMVGDRLETRPDPDAVLLGPDDVAEMTALVERTRPGPFLPRTHELGTYLGIRLDGELISMAGERMRPAGFSEISAVCTDERYRGKGLGARLVRAVGAVVRERGDVPFLHAAATNTGAIGLYEHLGFTHSRTTFFAAYRAPLVA